MRGQLPKPDRVRRNKPTVATTTLPAAGRQGPPPTIPKKARLKTAGKAWWKWAWHTPQACAWDDGAFDVVVRRAQLEDMAEWIDNGSTQIDVAQLLEIEPSDVSRQIDDMVKRLRGLASGRLAVFREMRELDDRLGLTPKAMLQFRWKIVDEVPEAEADPDKPAAPVRRLHAIDPTTNVG